jgi:hypothetical protein
MGGKIVVSNCPVHLITRRRLQQARKLDGH